MLSATTTTSMLLLCLSLTAQVKLERCGLALDYNTGVQTFLDKEKGYQLTTSAEYVCSDLFSVEAIYCRDRDNFLAFSFDSGLPVADINRRYRYSSKIDEFFLMGRLYPIENYHSQSLALRHKKAQGFYLSLGYGVLRYQRTNINLEVFDRVEVDTTGFPRQVLDSAFVHYHGYTLLMHGTQFGFGFKQHHNKYFYSDVKLHSSAYRHDSKNLSTWYVEDDDRNQASPYYLNRIDYERFITTLSRNGRGFVLTISVGINIDPR